MTWNDFSPPIDVVIRPWFLLKAQRRDTNKSKILLCSVRFKKIHIAGFSVIIRLWRTQAVQLQHQLSKPIEYKISVESLETHNITDLMVAVCPKWISWAIFIIKLFQCWFFIIYTSFSNLCHNIGIIMNWNDIKWHILKWKISHVMVCFHVACLWPVGRWRGWCLSVWATGEKVEPPDHFNNCKCDTTGYSHGSLRAFSTCAGWGSRDSGGVCANRNSQDMIFP